MKRPVCEELYFNIILLLHISQSSTRKPLDANINYILIPTWRTALGVGFLESRTRYFSTSSSFGIQLQLPSDVCLLGLR